MDRSRQPNSRISPNALRPKDTGYSLGAQAGYPPAGEQTNSFRRSPPPLFSPSYDTGRRSFLGLLAASAIAAATQARAAAPTLAILVDTVYTLAGLPIHSGVILVRAGKITAVGTRLPVPAGAVVLRAAAVMPGIIDAHCHLGCLNEIDEPLDAVTPDLRIRDGFDTGDPAIGRAIRAGVTTACIMPGNGNAIAGQASLFRLGGTLSLLRGYAAQKLSMSAGNAQRNPTSRAGVIAIIRAAFDGARCGQAVSSVTQTDLLAGFPTRLDQRPAALMPVVRGERPVFVHAQTSDDVENALGLFDAYHLKGCLLHASEAFELKEEIAKRRIPVVLGPLDFDDTDRTLSNAGKLANAGVQVAFCSDAPLTDPASLRLSAAIAVRSGLAYEKALRALTRTPAELLGIDRQTGSLQPGLDADLLLLNGDPLALTTGVEAVISGGAVAYRRKST